MAVGEPVWYVYAVLTVTHVMKKHTRGDLTWSEPESWFVVGRDITNMLFEHERDHKFSWHKRQSVPLVYRDVFWSEKHQFLSNLINQECLKNPKTTFRYLLNPSRWKTSRPCAHIAVVVVLLLLHHDQHHPGTASPALITVSWGCLRCRSLFLKSSSFCLNCSSKCSGQWTSEGQTDWRGKSAWVNKRVSGWIMNVWMCVSVCKHRSLEPPRVHGEYQLPWQGWRPRPWCHGVTPAERWFCWGTERVFHPQPIASCSSDTCAAQKAASKIQFVQPNRHWMACKRSTHTNKMC